MANAATLTRIGSNVRVQVEQVRDRIPGALLKKLKDNPRGRVVDYKMTDGGGVGLVVKLTDGTKNWFFENSGLSKKNRSDLNVAKACLQKTAETLEMKGDFKNMPGFNFGEISL